MAKDLLIVAAVVAFTLSSSLSGVAMFLGIFGTPLGAIHVCYHVWLDHAG